MIQFRILFKKDEVNYFMRFLIFLSMIIISSKAIKLHSSQKHHLQNISNESLTDKDFEDSLSPDVLAGHNYSLPILFEKNELIENEQNLLSSTQNDIDCLKITTDLIQPKKHRNIIKMVCDSDNLISQMTLHMNFLDNSKDEKHHDFTFKKVFNSNDARNISFSFPEISETLSGSKLNKIDEKPAKDIEISVQKLFNENEFSKKGNNINHQLLNEEYEANPVSKKKKVKTQTHNKDDYKSEIKKFNSGSGMKSSKSIGENYPSNLVKEKKGKNKLKFWVTAMTFNDDLQNSDAEKNELLRKLHLSHSSDYLDQLMINNTSDAMELNSGIELENNDDMSQVTDNIEDNYPQNSQHDNLKDKEYDGENKNNEEVLNYSKKFKKYKIANSKHTLEENENINQSDDTFLYDYPVGDKKQNPCKILNKDTDQVNKRKNKKKCKSWKTGLVTKPKMKSIVSYNRGLHLEENNSPIIANKRNKALQRKKVIENLKFILSKHGSGKSKTKSNQEVQSKYFSIGKPKDSPKLLNFSRKPEKENIRNVVANSDNQTKFKEFEREDKEAESSSAMSDVLFEYRNDDIPFDIYDIDMNDNDEKTKLREKESIHLANNENKKIYINQKDLCSKFDIPYIKENILNNKREKDKLGKYLVKRMAEEKGEEIRKNVFLKKGIPLQFNPYEKISELDNEHNLGFETMSPIGFSQGKLKNKNDRLTFHIENSFKSQQQKNFQSDSEDLKIGEKIDPMADNTYQKAYRRFLRDIALIKFLNDKNNIKSLFFSN